MTKLQKQLMDCGHCGGTGVDGDVDDRGLTIDVQCRSCAGSGKSRYFGKCADGKRCLQGCLSTEGCYWENRAAKEQAQPVSWTATHLWNKKDTWTCPADIEKDLLDRQRNQLAQLMQMQEDINPPGIQYVELHQWRRIDQPNQSGWFDDSKERAYYSDPARIEGRTVYVKKEN